jgi:hypothetical protein
MIEPEATLRDGTLDVTAPASEQLQRSFAVNLVLAPAIQSLQHLPPGIEGSKLQEKAITIAQLQRVCDIYQMNLHDLQNWAYRFLVALKKNGGQGTISERPSYEDIGTPATFYPKDDFLRQLFTYALRHDELILLLETINSKTPVGDVVEPEGSERRVGYRWKSGEKRAIYVCGFCGREQDVVLATGTTAMVKGCEGCGAKLLFHPPELPLHARKREAYTGEQIATEVSRLECLEGPEGLTVGALRQGLENLARIKSMDSNDLKLWFARIRLALLKIQQEDTPKFPFEDLPAQGGYGGILRELLGFAMRRLGSDLVKVRKICLATIDSRSYSSVTEPLGYNSNVEMYVCHACGDVFKFDPTGQRLAEVTVDKGMTNQGLTIPQIKCTCGSVDVHQSADTNPTEILPSQATEGQITQFLIRHFTLTEMRLLAMYTFGAFFDVAEFMPATTISGIASEFVDYARRHSALPDLATKIQNYRHESGVAGILRNYICHNCGRIETRTISKEGWIGGACQGCGGLDFVSAAADLTPMSRNRPFTGSTHLAADRRNSTETDSPEMSDTLPAELLNLQNEKFYRIRYLLLTVYDNERLLFVLRGSERFKRVAHNWAATGIREIVLQVFIDAWKNHNILELLKIVYKDDRNAILEALSSESRNAANGPKLVRFNFQEAREIIGYLDPALFLKLSEQEPYQGDKWQAALEDAKKNPDFNALVNLM